MFLWEQTERLIGRESGESDARARRAAPFFFLVCSVVVVAVVIVQHKGEGGSSGARLLGSVGILLLSEINPHVDLKMRVTFL